MSKPGSFLRDQIRGALLRKFGRFVGYAVACWVVGAVGVAILDGQGKAISALVIVMGMVLVVFGVLALVERTQPENYKSFKDLLSHFKVTLEELSMLVEEERAALPKKAASSLVVLPSWIWGPSGPLLIPIHEIAWVYPKSTTTYRNGVNQGTSHELIVRALYAPAKELSVAAGPSGGEAIIKAVAKHAPWAHVGFDPQRKFAMLIPHSQQVIVDEVRARREQLRGS